MSATDQNIAKLCRQAATAKLVSLQYDRQFVARAQRKYRRNCEEPGDCRGDYRMLAALAVAEAEVGMRPGWIPETQALAVKIADLPADAPEHPNFSTT